jgi:hypothetical protein
MRPSGCSATTQDYSTPCLTCHHRHPSAASPAMTGSRHLHPRRQQPCRHRTWAAPPLLESGLRSGSGAESQRRRRVAHHQPMANAHRGPGEAPRPRVALPHSQSRRTFNHCEQALSRGGEPRGILADLAVLVHLAHHRGLGFGFGQHTHAAPPARGYPTAIESCLEMHASHHISHVLLSPSPHLARLLQPDDNGKPLRERRLRLRDNQIHLHADDELLKEPLVAAPVHLCEMEEPCVTSSCIWLLSHFW